MTTSIIPRFTCIDCGSAVSAASVKRCRKCMGEHMSHVAARDRKPPHCVDCNQPLPNQKRNGICSPCKKARIAKTHTCDMCGGVVSTSRTKVCRNCLVSNAKHPICIDCGKPCVNIDAIRCSECHVKQRVGENNPRWKGAHICPQCGGRKASGKTKVCNQCKKEDYLGLPKCKSCGQDLSRYKPRNGKTRGGNYCRKCYKGDHTVRWNPEREDRGEKWRDVAGYAGWRSSVFKRDAYTCQKCNYRRGGKIVAHHIYSWKTSPEVRLEVANGITLCVTCHRRFHRAFGVTGNTKKQLDEFMNGRLL